MRGSPLPRQSHPSHYVPSPIVTDVALTFEVTVHVPADEIVRLLSAEQRISFMAGIARLLSAHAPRPPAEPPAPVLAGAEPPKERVGRIGHSRPPVLRPATVTCETPDCGKVLAVGSRGVLPRFCRRCSERRGHSDRPLRTKPRPAPAAEATPVPPPASLPPAHRLEATPPPPPPLAPADPRRAEAQRRISAMMALDKDDPCGHSRLLERFDERRQGPRR